MKKILILSLLLSVLTKNSFSQNVGIGTTDPEYKLDVNGRMRLRNAPGQSAGIWLDGIANTNIGFMGTYNNNTIGFYGALSNWQLVMNTDNGNVGIGTVAPTAKLDLNGTLRIRSSSPKRGSVLTSDDANGNASWADPVAFRCSGLLDGANVEIPYEIWTKVIFNTSPSYNLGLGYQPSASQFQATAGGVYHFDAQFVYSSAQYAYESRARLVLNRNGNLSTLAEARRHPSVPISGNDDIFPSANIELNTDAMLLAGDIVWLELWVPIFIKNWNGSNRNSLTLWGDSRLTWFSGHLVARN